MGSYLLNFMKCLPMYWRFVLFPLHTTIDAAKHCPIKTDAADAASLTATQCDYVCGLLPKTGV